MNMKKVCLIIIDGFGVAPPGPGNARTLADMPTLKKMEEITPNCLMDAAENAVGLPKGQQGASEPGHMTIGAGRVVWQPLEEINRAIQSGEFFKNEVLIGACDRSKTKDVPLHFMGIYSTGNVHGSTEHWHAMLKVAKDRGVKRVLLHLFSDGRDVSEQHFCVDFDLLKAEISKQSLGTIASLIGRWFAMDRDLRFDTRTKITYELLTQGKGKLCDDFCEGVKAWYAEAPRSEKTDLYIRPLVTSHYQPMRAEDVVVVINFRKDRMLQIVSALADETFDTFKRPVRINDVVCMGPYSEHLPIAFPPTSAVNSLGEVVSNAGKKQVRISETEKYVHVTYFFNQQRMDPFPGEEHIHVRTPDVPNMADAPDMAANEVCDAVIKVAKKGDKDLIIVNFANPDVVGHGGRIDAAVEACEAVDRNLRKLLPVLQEEGYDWIITADHGNAEEMYYPGTEKICPSHTTNKVQTFVHSPMITSSDQLKEMIGLRQGSPLRPTDSEGQAGRQAGLKDIAPLVLRMMGIPVPVEMR